MGYGMSRLEDEYYKPEGQNTDGSGSVQVNDEFAKLHNNVFHMTRMRSGLSESYKSMGTNRGIISTAKLLSRREIDCSGKGTFSSGDRAFVLGRYVPMNGPELLDRMDSRAYVSQFSADGTLFVAGFQGSHIRIYDADRGWSIHKDIHARCLRWTISDVSLSPDQRYLVSPGFSQLGARNLTLVVTSSSSCCPLPLHVDYQSDVNTVAFADETGHLIYSGSDDTLCKVWDRRCLSTGQAAGVLTGHLHGVTHIDSRGDGRSFISNGKDQAIKLWDVRKMTSNADSSADGAPTWDYRYSRYPQQHKQLKHPHDQSLATYRGHSVLRTLIRCYFSPAYSTGKKYIYTGSYDSCVHIYDVVSGSQVAKLKWHQMAIRDCSWHPHLSPRL
ncbi:LEC14B protein-like [Miscanthus floridulus]|uniref:LEC14B protein-like n=1 Tax=Miscanthus floridulus TaxID=154761 RepID=UPI003459646D